MKINIANVNEYNVNKYDINKYNGGCRGSPSVARGS